jgi:hypothetical protein
MLRKKKVIGRAEYISFPVSGIKNLPAKVDTGAYRSSIWATNIKEHNGTLSFTLLGPSSPYYTGKIISTTEYKLIEVENSFGHKQKRYSIFLSVEVAGRRVKSNFTLANRGMKTYPVLIGRKLLKNRFVVDVSKGNPIPDEEKANVENLD